MDYNFYMPVRVVSGKGAMFQCAGQLRSLGKRCLVVCSGHAARQSGALGDLETVCREQGIEYRVYDGIRENPLAVSCIEAGKLAYEWGAEFVVGIGGGSPLDAAKAVAAVAANPGLTEEELKNRRWINRPLTLVLVGTTAGTGCEITAAAVLTWSDGRKKSVTDDALFATLAVADPQYTASMPRSVTVSTALDALCHAVEGFLSPRCPDVHRHSARVAIPLVWDGLKRLRRGEELTEALREQLYYASLWAGLIISGCGTSFPHGFSYFLTEDFHIPHGRACAVFLPSLVEHTIPYAPNLTAELLHDLLGCSLEEMEELVADMRQTGPVVMTPEQIEAYKTERMAGLKNFKNVYGAYTEEDGAKLFYKLFCKEGERQRE